ncbi:hypothetical protein [Thermoanaerobacterium thermosaccharolyticum]
MRKEKILNEIAAEYEIYTNMVNLIQQFAIYSRKGDVIVAVRGKTR